MTIPVAPTKMSGSDPKKIGGAWSFIHRFNALVDWIISLSPVGAVHFDTREVSLNSALATGFTSTNLTARRMGRTVEISGYVTATAGFPAGSSLTDVIAASGVPAEFRPPVKNRPGSAWLSSSFTGVAIARPDGSLAIGNQTGATRNAAQISITYMVA